jgi:uncharacterized membrane protein
METHHRSLVKTVTWRLISTMMILLISWALTRQFKLALTIGAVDILVKSGTYYLHERAWARISFGRSSVAPPEYEI